MVKYIEIQVPMNANITKIVFHNVRLYELSALLFNLSCVSFCLTNPTKSLHLGDNLYRLFKWSCNKYCSKISSSLNLFISLSSPIVEFNLADISLKVKGLLSGLNMLIKTSFLFNHSIVFMFLPNIQNTYKWQNNTLLDNDKYLKL